MATLKLEIITPEAKTFSEDVDMVTLTGAEGEMGILPQHMPLMTQLIAGEIVAQKGGETIFLAVGDGFVQVTGDRVSILTDMAIRAENIDEAAAEEAEPAEGEAAPDAVEAQAEAKQARRAARVLREPVEKQTPRELYAHIVETGKKDYSVQRYKGLGEMTSSQLWETTMDPERRTLLQVKLEDIVETNEIFTTLMGEDVEKRRKFIEDNALDVKNLDI